MMREASRRLLAVLLSVVVGSLSMPSTGDATKGQAPVAKKRATERHASRQVVMHASWYGAKFQGRRTADGSRFDTRELTAAHRSWRFGTRLRVTNPRNGREVVVKVTDRGPFVRGRELDLSYAAARELGIVHSGVARVHVEVLNAGEVTTVPPEPIVVAYNQQGVGGAWPRAIVR